MTDARKEQRTLMAIAAAMFVLRTSCAVDAADWYCGVYAAARAGQSLGLSVDMEALIDSKYISSHMGSTGQDLVEAAEAIELKGTLLSGLGKDSLLAATSPLILHAAPMGSHTMYQHWILLLGFDEKGDARIVDGSGGVATCSLNEVLARWDGIAVAVRRPDMPSTRFVSSELSGLLSLIAISALLCLILKWIARDRNRERTFAQVITSGCLVLVTLLAISVGVGYATRGNGFDKAVAGIDYALRLREPVVITRTDVVERLSDGATLIDCRYAGDYERGTIGGAISLPVDVGLGELQRILAPIDRQTSVIVFCQSEHCGFSAYMVNLLAGAGFENLAIYKGGYVEWTNHGDDNNK